MANEKKPVNPKGFVEKIKYFLTEPVKNSAEADARKKELIPFTLVPLGLAFAFIALGMAIEPVKIVFDILGYISMFFVFVFGWCLYKAISLKGKFKDLECPKCQAVIKYSPDFKIEVKSKEFKVSDGRRQNPQAGVDITVEGVEWSTVVADCKCQECGTEKKLTKSFRTVECAMVRKGVSIITADAVALEMRKVMQAAYESGFENCPSDLNVKTKTTGEKAMVEYFREDGTAGKTPWGTVTKSKK